MRYFVWGQDTGFDPMRSLIERVFIGSAAEVSVGEWQSIVDQSHPASTTFELRNVSVEGMVPSGYGSWGDLLYGPEYDANHDWAEEHFQERVGGKPLNPPPSAERWPHAQKNNEEHKTEGEFSHTYPERFWPKWAGGGVSNFRNGDDGGYWGTDPHRGIRFPYGDLQDVVDKLHRRPGTRQAYLPIYFPEDNGAPDDARVPCTLGYHFLIRDNLLHMKYDIRSCDFIRHFRDDLYMAGRLMQWVTDELTRIHASPIFPTDTNVGRVIQPGQLHMSIHSFHIFKPDMLMLRRKYDRET